MIKCPKALSAYLQNIFAVDLRSLALLRIGVGLISIYNLILYYPSMELFFGPLGVFPLADPRPSPLFSLHALSENISYIHFLFALHLLFSIMLLFGYKTRVATVLCWAMTVSLYNRAPEICFGGDDVLRTLLLWGIFLPWGERLSADDASLKNKPIVSNTYSSAASAVMILHLVIIYLINGFGKVDPHWSIDFSALYYIFNDHVAKDPAKALVLYPDLLRVLTFLSLVLERAGVILLFLPSVMFFRSLAILLFIIFHLCIDYTLNVGWFSWIMIIYWIALIPSPIWDIKKTQNPTEPHRIPTGFTENITVILLLALITISNYFYMQNHIVKIAWRKSLFFKTIHFIALDQDLLKFSPVSDIRQKFTFTPVFENGVHLDERSLKEYHFPRAPNFRTGKIINWRGNMASRNKHYAYLKSYLKNYWNKKFANGPKVVDVIINIKMERVLPEGSRRAFLKDENF